MEFNFEQAILWTVIWTIFIGVNLMLYFWREGHMDLPFRNPKRAKRRIGYWQDRINVVVIVIIFIQIWMEDMALMA